MKSCTTLLEDQTLITSVCGGSQLLKISDPGDLKLLTSLDTCAYVYIPIQMIKNNTNLLKE